MAPRRLYPSYFKLQVRWLLSVARITYLSKLIGPHSIAAFLKFELFRVDQPGVICRSSVYLR
ncbi:hypothetical protein PRCB_07555 [Pantoea rodasii]|uniref:Uncharacterized protein n=1 Tax=Pantoea rodasii TaxID=1076549 RepID=A0A2M9WGA0_9GAMM|nr:hypothetical protein PRCB_07555 [Pantoea rodasii]